MAHLLASTTAVLAGLFPRRLIGGHVAPFEQPELYAQELRDFFRPYR